MLASSRAQLAHFSDLIGTGITLKGAIPTYYGCRVADHWHGVARACDQCRQIWGTLKP